MEQEINEQIEIIHEAWNSLLDDYQKLGLPGGYIHMREEDLRSFLFCKIIELLRKQKLFLLDLHADIPLPRKRADIVLGLSDEAWHIGVEIKTRRQPKPIREDLEKLQIFMKDKQIEAGVFLAIFEHSWNMRECFSHWGFDVEFKLEERDRGNNNFTEWRRLTIEERNIDYDALFLVLRAT